nr:uncharacterized protein LOC113813249 [Penaeus vannamei]
MLQRQLPETMAFKYLGSTLETGGGVGAEVNRRIQCGWNNWKKMSGILCDTSIPSKVKGRIHMWVIQPAMLYGMETVPLSTRNTNRRGVPEMKMSRWACGHTLKDHVMNEVIPEKNENHTHYGTVQESPTKMRKEEMRSMLGAEC